MINAYKKSTNPDMDESGSYFETRDVEKILNDILG